jgi:hypothetical protein
MRLNRLVRRIVGFGLLASALAGGQAPSVPAVAAQAVGGPRDPRALLGRVKLEAFRYQRDLPNFIYDQLTTRTVDESGSGKHWKQRDTLEVQDISFDSFVNHKLIAVNGKATTQRYGALDGFLSEAVLHSVGFLPRWLFGLQAKTQFEWLREGTIADRKVQVFSLHLAPSDSKFTISTPRQSFVAGIDGEIFVDDISAVIRRFTIRMDLPANCVLQEGTLKIDYGPVAISSRQFFLPVQFEVRAHYGVSLVRNETQVVRYQKYAAETTIHFDPEPPGLPGRSN